MPNVTDANGVTVTNTYDKLNRLLTRGYPDGGVEKFGYSGSGLVAYTNQIGNASSYTLDALSRKTGETNADSQTIAYGYDSASDLLSLTDGKNQTTKWAYRFLRARDGKNQPGRKRGTHLRLRFAGSASQPLERGHGHHVLYKRCGWKRNVH